MIRPRALLVDRQTISVQDLSERIRYRTRTRVTCSIVSSIVCISQTCSDVFEMEPY